MRFTILSITIIVGVAIAQPTFAQVGGQSSPWRGAGEQPCFSKIDNSANRCPATRGIVAVKAGRLFDANSATLRNDQVIVIEGERIVAVGPAKSTKIPSGAVVIDLSKLTVLPGLIDLHTHMFNTPKPGVSREMSTLIAIQNIQNDLHAGFTSVRDMGTHGNGYADVDVRNAIDSGLIEGPRAQVSTRGIIWSGVPSAEAARKNPLESAVVSNEDEARAAVQDQIKRGADWIKIFPTASSYSFAADGTVTYVSTYPMPVLQALIDETHRLGRKTACHVFGGEGQKNAILAGCDSIEHAWGLDQEQALMMSRKQLSFDPTMARYTEPYMDDNDSRNTGGKYRMIPIINAAVAMAAKTPGLKLTVGSGVDGSTFPHGTQALEYVALVKQAGMSAASVIQAGTKNNAEVLGWYDRVGSVETGKYADIVAVSGNPLMDITELKHVRFVMKGGLVVHNDVAAK